MPWNEVNTVILRSEFVRLAQNEGTNISQLYERFQISRKTGYKWLARFRAQSDSGLSGESRRPTSSPRRTRSDVETEVLRLHDQHSLWGGRKLFRPRLVALTKLRFLAMQTRPFDAAALALAVPSSSIELAARPFGNRAASHAFCARSSLREMQRRRRFAQSAVKGASPLGLLLRSRLPSKLEGQGQLLVFTR